MHFLWFQITVKQLNISTSAINILFMFDRVLDDEVFAFITEWREFLGQGIEPSVLRRLYTFVSLSIVVESTRAMNKLAELFAGMFRVCPFALKRIYGTIKTSNKHCQWRRFRLILTTNNNNRYIPSGKFSSK